MTWYVYPENPERAPMTRLIIFLTFLLGSGMMLVAQTQRAQRLSLIDTTGGAMDTVMIVPSPYGGSYQLQLPPDAGISASLLVSSVAGST
ncbi:hypothetical protein, partial [Aphanothece microscopica]|uniref:hypothetical protein n=1 Tax=Aphanothece microscopica TaxID=1049561 RepID=UPI0039854EBE